MLFNLKFYVYCMFCRLLFVLFLLAIGLSVLRYTNSDYPFGIFKLFLNGFFNQKKNDIIEILLKVLLKARNNSLSGTNITNINDRGMSFFLPPFF